MMQTVNRVGLALAIVLVGCGGGGGGTPDAASPDAAVTPDTGPRIDAYVPPGPDCDALAEDYVNSDAAECSTCVADTCCDQMAACDESADCQSLLACANAAAGDEAAIQACAAMYPSAVTLVQAINTCQTNECATECATGQICDTGLVHPVVECGQCLSAECCDEFRACTDEAACQACLTGSGTDCDTMANYTAATTCQDTNCMAECQGICGSDYNYPERACTTCVTGSCCTQFDACIADDACRACATGGGSGCDTNALMMAYDSCVMTSCSAECGG